MTELAGYLIVFCTGWLGRGIWDHVATEIKRRRVDAKARDEKLAFLKANNVDPPLPGVWAGHLGGRYMACQEDILPALAEFVGGDVCSCGNHYHGCISETDKPPHVRTCEMIGMFCDIGDCGWELVRCLKCQRPLGRTHENSKEEFRAVLGVEIRY